MKGGKRPARRRGHAGRTALAVAHGDGIPRGDEVARPARSASPKRAARPAADDRSGAGLGGVVEDVEDGLRPGPRRGGDRPAAGVGPRRPVSRLAEAGRAGNPVQRRGRQQRAPARGRFDAGATLRGRFPRGPGGRRRGRSRLRAAAAFALAFARPAARADLRVRGGGGRRTRPRRRLGHGRPQADRQRDGRQGGVQTSRSILRHGVIGSCSEPSHARTARTARQETARRASSRLTPGSPGRVARPGAIGAE
jgi:hypothetical protein